MNVQARVSRQGVIRRYRRWLPEIPDDAIATIGEGETPLIEATRISDRVGARLFLKFEGMNPTASFKDRGMTVAMSRAAATGSRACVCASTGNTAASAAAYAARASMECFVVVPAGKIALGKAVQVLAHGARIVQIEGNFDAALKLSKRIAEELGDVTLVNSVNPDRIEGQKTAAFEVAEALGDPPDAVALPVGNAGNITSYWKGFREWRGAGHAGSVPRMLGFQAEDASPLVAGHDFESPETVASAIRIGSPASKEGALSA
ncbi:MAG TPA: threonine synthase, partial [Rubrobacter sp.]|nr:threonine synthase [Rubrobacter sp.]